MYIIVYPFVINIHSFSHLFLQATIFTYLLIIFVTHFDTYIKPIYYLCIRI